MIDISNVINSLKGISGTGNVLAQSIKNVLDFVGTLDPGDIVRGKSKTPMAVPVAADLWYLWYHMNFLAGYQDHKGEDGYHFDYKPYLAANMDFLTKLTKASGSVDGILRPLKILRDLPIPIAEYGDDWWEHVAGPWYDSWKMMDEWGKNGVYWINLAAFELWPKDKGAQYPSDGPVPTAVTDEQKAVQESGQSNFKINDYVGYIAWPIGLLGVIEVISLIQETNLSGYKFVLADVKSNYWSKTVITPDLKEEEKVSFQETLAIFPDMKDMQDKPLTGVNYCYGRHIVEDVYRIPDNPIDTQNKLNSEGGTAYAPVPKFDTELYASDIKDYGEDIKPKKWMRYWIHKDSVFPVPGEFIGVLCRPVAAAPHVWFFQESSPFLYAGNWMETGNLTSGTITEIIPEVDRTDGGIGNQYKIKIQGCEVLVNATDFLSYSVGDRVAILKVANTALTAERSFTWKDQVILKKTDEQQKKTDYVIIPSTFYKIKT